MTSNILPIAFTAASGAAGSITTGLMGASIIAGGLVAAVPVALVVIVDKALDHFCSDLSKLTTGLLKMGSWFVILSVTGFVGSLVLGPLGLLFALPCLIMIAILLFREVRDLENEIAHINSENVKKTGKHLDESIASCAEMSEVVKQLFDKLEQFSNQNPSKELKDAIAAKIEIVKANMNEINQIIDTLKKMDEQDVEAVLKKTNLVYDKINLMSKNVLDEPFLKLLNDHGIYFDREKAKEPEPSLV